MYYRKFSLLEQAAPKKKILDELYASNRYIITHLLCIYLWYDTEYVTHWKKEVYTAMSDIPKMKHNNKFPNKEVIYNNTFGVIEDVFLDRFDHYIELVSLKEDKLELPHNLNPRKVKNYLEDYFIWLSDKLSTKGYVSLSEVNNEIDNLLYRYR